MPTEQEVIDRLEAYCTQMEDTIGVPLHRRHLPSDVAAVLPPPRHRRRAGLLAAAAVVAVAGIGAVSLTGAPDSPMLSDSPAPAETSPDTTETTSPDTEPAPTDTKDTTATDSTAESASVDPTVPAPGADGWQVVSPSPLSARTNAVAVWTGTEVLVIGGEPRASCPPNASCAVTDLDVLADGAAYDPQSGTWRSIAPSPVPVSGFDSFAVAGGSVYVLSALNFMRYVITEDRWEQPRGPADQPYAYSLVATGDSVVAYRGSDENGERPDLLFDQASATWHELPADPLSPSFNRAIVAVGADLYLFAHDLVANPGVGGTVTRPRRPPRLRELVHGHSAPTPRSWATQYRRLSATR